MDEPTHEQESRFWDHVADWILGGIEPWQSALTPWEIYDWMEQVQQDPPQRH